MISELRTPSYPLDQFIESYFYFNGVTLEHQLERYLPDGNVQLKSHSTFMTIRHYERYKPAAGPGFLVSGRNR